MAKPGKYDNTLKNTKVEGESLVKNGEVLLSVGDEYFEKQNPKKVYRCKRINLHFVVFEKIGVMDFENSELGKAQEYQTTHFIEDELNLAKK